MRAYASESRVRVRQTSQMAQSTTDLDVGLQGRGVPGGVGDERHERVRAVDVTPVHAADAMQLDLLP